MEKKAWPYVAGMLDAEGTIQVAVNRRNNGIIGISLQIIIANTEVKLMKWLVANFGGRFYRRKNQRGFSAPSSPDIYFWWVFGKENQEAFLLGILPYVVAKAEQVRLALEFIRLNGWNKERRLKIADDVKTAKISDIEKDRKQCLSKPSPHDASSYVAGLFDGDGTIGSTIELTQKRFVLIRWMLMNFGGRFNERTMNGGKTYFRWCLSGKKNKHDFLLDIIPHLLLKREKAKELLTSLRASDLGSATTEMLNVSPRNEDTV